MQRPQIDFTEATASSFYNTFDTLHRLDVCTLLSSQLILLALLTLPLRPSGALLSQFLSGSRGRLISGYLPVLDIAPVKGRVWQVSVSSALLRMKTIANGSNVGRRRLLLG